MSSRRKSESSKKATGSEAQRATHPKRALTDRIYIAGRGRNGEEWHLELISGYDLRWENLRKWLEGRFKGTKLKLQDQNGRDWFEVNLPQRLSKADHMAIDELREPVYEEPEEKEPEETHEPDPVVSD